MTLESSKFSKFRVLSSPMAHFIEAFAECTICAQQAYSGFRFCPKFLNESRASYKVNCFVVTGEAYKLL